MSLEFCIIIESNSQKTFSLRAGSPRDWGWGRRSVRAGSPSTPAPVPRRACSQAKRLSAQLICTPTWPPCRHLKTENMRKYTYFDILCMKIWFYLNELRRNKLPLKIPKAEGLSISPWSQRMHFMHGLT